jgi:cell division cycle 14
MIVQRRAPWEAFHPIAEIEFMPFRDAGRGPSDFNLSIQDCLWGMWKAMQNGLCDMNEFSVEEYEYYEKVENGDWNWITPNFIAFASPVDSAWIKNQKEAKQAAAGPSSPARPGTASPTRSPAINLALQRKLSTPFCNCLDYFEKRGVKVVVRLNTELYDKQLFLDRGINHQELYFDDGTNPTDEIVRTFIDLSDTIVESGGVIAVHVRHFLPIDFLVITWRVRGNNSLSVQSRSGTNWHFDRGLSHLEIRVYRDRGHCFHAYRSAWKRGGPATTIHVPQAIGMGKVGSN